MVLRLSAPVGWCAPGCSARVEERYIVGVEGGGRETEERRGTGPTPSVSTYRYWRVLGGLLAQGIGDWTLDPWGIFFCDKLRVRNLVLFF